MNFFWGIQKFLIGGTKHKILKKPVSWQCWWAPLKAKSSFYYCNESAAWHLLSRLPQVHPPGWWCSWLSCSSRCGSGTWGMLAALQGPGCPGSCWWRLHSLPSGNCGSGSEALASVHWISWQFWGGEKRKRKKKDIPSNPNGLTRSENNQMFFPGTAWLEQVITQTLYIYKIKAMSVLLFGLLPCYLLEGREKNGKDCFFIFYKACLSIMTESHSFSLLTAERKNIMLYWQWQHPAPSTPPLCGTFEVTTLKWLHELILKVQEQPLRWAAEKALWPYRDECSNHQNQLGRQVKKEEAW